MSSMILSRSVLARTGGLPSYPSRKNQLLPHFNGYTAIHSQSKSSFAFTLRCMAEEAEDRENAAPDASISDFSPSTVPKPDPPATSPAKPKVMSTKFSDLFAFSGPAPERINGRLAMIGFVAVMAVEVLKGQDLFAQISGGGVPWFIGTTLLLSTASVVPLLKGVRAEAQTKGFMNADAELWNGRFAMLGLVALAFTEYVKGGTLV